jgi:hypothetical protein
MSNTTPPYIFKLAAGKLPQKQTLALHLLVSFVLFTAAIFCLVLYWFTHISPGFRNSIPVLGIFGGLCAGGAILIYYLAIRAVRRQSQAGLVHGLELLLLGGGAVIFYLADWEVPAVLFGILAALVALAFLYELRAPVQPQVAINEQGIVRTAGLQRKGLDWAEVKQVLLRRGVLTIDCLDNRLFQYTVEGSQMNNGADFEAFCMRYIEEAIPRREKGDW